MGSSAKKKKKSKTADFQKPKLRVGKAKPVAANHTNTSFASRSVHLPSQSLSIAAPSTNEQIAHHVSLLKNRSASQRQASLSYLTNVNIPELAGSATEILPRLPPLLHDESAGVRSQTVKLLRRFPVHAIQTYMDQLLLWTRAGLTHLSTEVRVSAMDTLDWLVEVAGEEVVSAKGSWVGLQRALITAMGWKEMKRESGQMVEKEEDRKGWSNIQKQGTRLGQESKLLSRQLGSLCAFIDAGMRMPTLDVQDDKAREMVLFMYPHLRQHAIPRHANAYEHLNLFGPPVDEENQILDNREDRQRVFSDLFEQTIHAGIEQVKKEGGELGRRASKLHKVVESCMADFHS